MPAPKTLPVAEGFSLPIEAVTETFAILAIKRAGKSNTGVVMAEAMYDVGIPWVAVDPKGDWWGVRASADGKHEGLKVVVFGGEHADVPLEPTAGTLVADLIVDHRLTCVLDVSEMTKADQRRFLYDFATRLYKRNREPIHVFCEEADEYIPQQVRGDTAKLVSAFETLVKRGGFRGIGITLISQRSASLNKDVLTQAGTLIALRITSPQDRKAVLAWIDHHAASKDIIDDLPSLENGEAWIYSPSWLRVLKKVTFLRRRTYDSGATPTFGEKSTAPTRLADIDLEAIRDQLAESIERAKIEDPKFWRDQVTELKQQIARLQKAVDGHVCLEGSVIETRVDVVSDERVAELRQLIEDLFVQAESQAGFSEALEQTAQQMAADLARATAAQNPVTTRAQRAPTPIPRRQPRPVDRKGEVVQPTPSHVGESDRMLGKGEKQILIAVASHEGGVSNEQLTVLTGYKRSSRNTYLQRLSAAGYVVRSGDRIQATVEGVHALGTDYEPLPTGAALRQYWLDRLSGGERAILNELIHAYPQGLSGEEIDALTGYKRSSRNTYLQRLRARELVVADSGQPGIYTASTILF